MVLQLDDNDTLNVRLIRVNYALKIKILNKWLFINILFNLLFFIKSFKFNIIFNKYREIKHVFNQISVTLK